MRISVFILSLFIIVTQACSTSQEAAKGETQKDEIYVFDDAVIDTIQQADAVVEEINEKVDIDTLVADEGTINVEKNILIEEKLETDNHFIVQVGAFSTKDKAEKLIEEAKSLVDYELTIHYNDEVNLFVVWLPKFKSREEAEAVRNNLWNKNNFRDAFIITIQ